LALVTKNRHILKKIGLCHIRHSSIFFRSHLKNVFCPNLYVGASFQLLGILLYACGLNIGPALILNQNPMFEMASCLKKHGFLLQKVSQM